MAKPVVITLNVQANRLYGIQNPTQSDVDNCCSLNDDNNGNSPNGTIESFTSIVYINNNVKWVGATNDSGYTVAITSIVYEPDSTDVNFFDWQTLNGSGGRSGNVNANVRNDNNLLNQHDVYTIFFRVYSSGTDFKTYSIDPKLAINQ
ncbi:hypothetical protein [Flavobacterium sp.]|uniref:hypothetical protein n=1 Tax=Flavobacterium sp. TaxID=239 RepID=UPI00286BAA52|nr:hypothetical protein [Flavobacterium sp.]